MGTIELVRFINKPFAVSTMCRCRFLSRRKRVTRHSSANPPFHKYSWGAAATQDIPLSKLPDKYLCWTKLTVSNSRRDVINFAQLILRLSPRPIKMTTFTFFHWHNSKKKAKEICYKHVWKVTGIKNPEDSFPLLISVP